MTNNAINIQQLQFSWQSAQPVIQIPEFTLETGERVFIKGPSGSGKTTLLNLLGGLLRPSRGTLRVLDRDLGEMSAAAIDRFRADHIGFVFQQFNLLPYLSLIDNVILPCRFSPYRKKQAEQRYGSIQQGAITLLKELGLDPQQFQNQRAVELSTGQQQRVAVARALLGSPELVIADEPTSALDSDLRDQFINLLNQQCDSVGATLIFVSHDASLQKHFDRVEILSPGPEGGFQL